MGCDGGDQAAAFKLIERKGGIDTEESYPYEGKYLPIFGKLLFREFMLGNTSFFRCPSKVL